MVEVIRQKLDCEAVPMERVAFSKENYDKLFPRGQIKTPLGIVVLGRDQFDKMKRKNREHLLGAMHQTLVDPIAVLLENVDRQEA